MNCDDVMAIAPLYLSGELDQERRDVVCYHLKGCASCGSALEQMTEADTVFRDTILSEPLDTSTLDRSIRQSIAPSRRRWLVVAGSIAAAVVIAAGLTYRAATRPDPACIAAISDHHREVIDAERRNWLFETKAIEALAVREGIESSVISRICATGLRLERGKRCRLDGRVFLHLVYSDGSQAYSVYLRQDSPAARGIRTTGSDGEHVAYFDSPKVRAIVVANQSRDSAIKVAQLVERAL